MNFFCKSEGNAAVKWRRIKLSKFNKKQKITKIFNMNFVEKIQFHIFI